MTERDAWFADWLVHQSLAFRLRFVARMWRDWFESYVMLPLGMWLLHAGRKEKRQ